MRFKRVSALVISMALTLSILGADEQAKAVDTFNNTEYSVDSPESPWIVVNKMRPLTPISYIPARFQTPKEFNPSNVRLARSASIAYVALAKAAKAAGAGTLQLNSGYRSYLSQKAIHKTNVARYGLKVGENLAARPGFSEHQTGLAADVAVPSQGCTIKVCFGTTKMGKWLAKNAWKYGYIVRYPSGKTAITGYQYEPWHLRFIGVPLANEMHELGETVLESYWGLTPAPTY